MNDVETKSNSESAEGGRGARGEREEFIALIRKFQASSPPADGDEVMPIVLEAQQAVRLAIRPMQSNELDRLGEIDRTERIERIYIQRGATLEESAQTFDVPPWSPTGTHAHSVPDQVGFLKWHVSEGGQAFGAFDGERLVGIGLVTPHIRPGIAQLSYLHVSNGYRGRGVGRRLVAELERVAREAGDAAMVVSATPTVNTVRFYMGCGYAPMAEPLAELFEKEPEDVHLSKRL
jgi:ribosomal protein S18 acetylase RimI-like enzyme